MIEPKMIELLWSMIVMTPLIVPILIFWILEPSSGWKTVTKKEMLVLILLIIGVVFLMEWIWFHFPTLDPNWYNWEFYK